MLGLRRGELCALRWENFDFNLKIVHVIAGVVYTPETGLIVADPKTKLSVRDLPLTDSLIQLLKSWRKEQSALLKVELLPTAFAFAGAENPYQPPRPDSVSRWLRNFSRRNNLPEGLSPHILRHSCASLLIAAGASVKDTQDFLGHSDPETTLKFYAATTQDRLDAAGNALANILDL